MKRFTALFTALMLLFTAAAALADTKITVSGTGEIPVSADNAIISLGVNIRESDVLTAQQEANRITAAIREALTALGIPQDCLNTDLLNVYVIYDYQGGDEKVSGYNASSTLAVKVTDMDKVGPVIDAAFAAGANTLNGITYSATDTEEAKAEALKKAVADAKAKADVLAEASGLKITGVRVITEGGVYSYENNVGNVYAKAAGSMDYEAAEDAGTVVQSAKLIVSASVSITYTAE